MARAVRLLSLATVAAVLQAGEYTALRIAPSNISLSGSGAKQHLIVLAETADGERDVTAEASITSSHPAVASVTPEREVRGIVAGQSAITARIAGFSASTQVTVGDRHSEVGVRFSPEVISILTIKGCNGSGCHGSPAGQNGFKLSLFGYDIAADHAMIAGRRIDTAAPENSLLLKKPTFQVAHGGGRLMAKDSEEYRTLLTWISQGARLETNGPRLTRMEIFPSEYILAGASAKLQVVVMGRLSDGTTRDMTREVRYSVADDTVVRISPEGVVTSGARGLTTVLARGMGQVAAAQMGVVNGAPERLASSADPSSNFIDEFTSKLQRRLNLHPAPLCSDRDFVRRVYIDTIGLLPTVEEVERFVADPVVNKRARLIDALLDRPEYASFWTVKFEDWFRNNQLNSQGRSMGRFKDWLHDWIEQDAPYDRVVRELLTSQGDTFRQPATNFWHPAADFMLKKFDVKKVTPTVTRLFLGIRLECAECHNHPLENYTQDDFYGLSAFFVRMRVKHGTGEYRRTWYLADEGEIEHPISKKPVPPRLLGEPEPAAVDSGDRRTALANWITSPANAYFARATVNRIWNEYFQTGIVEPVDDLRSTNPPTNRELLDVLARNFMDSGFRLKALHRVILNSRTYQLSSKSDNPKELARLERMLFARYEPRRLSAEVLLDSITQVTGVPHTFRNHPVGTRATEVYVPDAPDYFLVTFGLPRRDILCERSKTPTLSQALHMINGDTILQKVSAKNNVLDQRLDAGWDDTRIASEVYLRAYARPPSADEFSAVREFLANESAAGRTHRRALEGLLWTVLNSEEFQVNH